MDCRQCSNNLTAYLDGELLSSYEQEVSSHLQACADCTRLLREMEASADFVQAHARDLELKPELWNNLRTRIAPMPVPRSAVGLFGLWARNRWLTAAAAVAATVVLAFALYGYMSYVENQEIRQYMSDYISERRAREMQSIETESLDFNELANPFTPARPVSIQNPFR